MKNIFSVAICDDDKNNRDEIHRYVDGYFNEKKGNYSLKKYSSGEELLDEIEDQGYIDILFLDIEMPGKTGIEIKKILETNNRVGSIVFVTSHVDVMQEAFGMKVIGFITKPFMKESIWHWTSTVYNLYMSSKRINIKKNVSVRVIDIRYIEADGIYTCIELNDGTVSELMREPISKWQEMVDDLFVRCHKSFLVNMRYISEIKYKELILNDGKIIPVGRKYAIELKNIYHKYLLENIKGRIGWDN